MLDDGYTVWLQNRIRSLRVRQQETRQPQHREELIKHLQDCLKKYREINQRSHHGQTGSG